MLQLAFDDSQNPSVVWEQETVSFTSPAFEQRKSEGDGIVQKIEQAPSATNTGWALANI